MSSANADVETITKLKKPSLYKVLLLNDDYTPMDFVIEILKVIFNKSQSEAFQLTMEIHDKGKGTAGTFTKEIATQKSLEVVALAQRASYPLRATVEEA